MGAFSEFLEREAALGETRKSFATATRDEWVQSVRHLLEQIREWLREDDPNERLTLKQQVFSLREARIGEYDIPGLSITFGLTDVRVEPIARFVAGPRSATGVVSIARAYGRVDLTDGLNTYMMFRTELRPDGSWVMIEQDGYRLQPLNRQSFEEALQALFR